MFMHYPAINVSHHFYIGMEKMSLAFFPILYTVTSKKECVVNGYNYFFNAVLVWLLLRFCGLLSH